MKEIKPYNKQELIQMTDGKLIFPQQIQEAFASCLSIELHIEKTDGKALLHHLITSGVQCFADFYYAALTGGQQEAFANALLPEEKNIFCRLIPDPDRLFYPLSEETLDFFYGITLRELLFSTFYISDVPAALWGNYGGLWPLFCGTETDLAYYEALVSHFTKTSHFIK